LNILITVSVIFIAVLTFFLWAGNQARVRHAKFEKKDVISALCNLISEDSVSHDEFDLFVGHPILDPYLEAVRQRALDICRKHPGKPNQDISEAGANEIAKLIEELQLVT
jgi:hypothetical protein